MVRIQTPDSTFDAPQFKTRPNTLRPPLRREGQWTISDPVPLPEPTLRGEVHRIAVECRGAWIEVLLDGASIHRQSDFGLRTGAVGFRASGPAEEGRFCNISLKKL